MVTPAATSVPSRFAVVLLVNTDKLPVGLVTELIAAAKKEPGKIDYASGGIGNSFHLASEMFGQAAVIKLNHVPYRGAGPALQDLVADQIGMIFVDFATARGQLNNRQIKAICGGVAYRIPRAARRPARGDNRKYNGHRPRLALMPPLR
jgi:tripartite-type tricarboxylate transporter receptor subunit TctC